jgi:hypothetical protein
MLSDHERSFLLFDQQALYIQKVFLGTILGIVVYELFMCEETYEQLLNLALQRED